MFRSDADTRMGSDREQTLARMLLCQPTAPCCQYGNRGFRYVADFCAALGQAAACQYLLTWGVGTQSTMANGKEPDLGEDVDLVMNLGRRFAERLGAGGARGTRCWNSGAKTARRNGLQPAQDGGSAPHRGGEGSGDAASRVSLVPGIVLTASMSKSYCGAHCARSTAATAGAIDRLGVGREKIV